MKSMGVSQDANDATIINQLKWVKILLGLILVAMILCTVEISSAITNGYSFFMGG